MKTKPKLTLNPAQTHVMFAGDWHEILQDQDGEPYFIRYTPSGAHVIYFDVKEVDHVL